MSTVRQQRLGNGQLKEPQGIATDSEGNIWVADTGNNRIEEFNAKGEFIRKVGTVGTGNGQLNGPSGLASTQKETSGSPTPSTTGFRSSAAKGPT